MISSAAVSLRNSSFTSRACASSATALDVNEACRCPLREGMQCKDDLRDLYKLHLKNTAMPPNFATLLQVKGGGQVFTRPT